MELRIFRRIGKYVRGGSRAMCALLKRICYLHTSHGRLKGMFISLIFMLTVISFFTVFLSEFLRAKNNSAILHRSILSYWTLFSTHGDGTSRRQRNDSQLQESSGEFTPKPTVLQSQAIRFPFSTSSSVTFSWNATRSVTATLRKNSIPFSGYLRHTSPNVNNDKLYSRRPDIHKLCHNQTLWDNVLRWESGELESGSPQWQCLDSEGKALVYSAHYDDVETTPVIRVVGLAKFPLPYSDVLCRYYAVQDASRVTHTVSGKLFHFRKPNGRKYLGAYVVCPLDKDPYPLAVSVVTANSTVTGTYMFIHYSSNITSAPSDKNSHYMEKRRWNVTRCFPAFQQQYNNHNLLSEIVAASVVLGVDHFMFYIESVGPEVNRTLQELVKMGIAHVLPWNMHMSESDLFYVGQFSAIQDCLYRHVRSSRYVLTADADELFVPKSRDNLLPLLDDLFSKRPECGAFFFLNTFFNLELDVLPPSQNESALLFAKEHNLNITILLHTVREKKVFPAGSRSKPAIDPLKVLTGSVHIIETFRQGFKTCEVKVEDGLLYHFRNVGKVPENETMVEFYLWKFSGAIANKTFEILNKFRQSTVN